jgi:hypothetical protein
MPCSRQYPAAAFDPIGLDLTDSSGCEALIREVRRSAAMVDWLAWRVAGLDEDDMTWVSRPGGSRRPRSLAGRRRCRSSSGPDAPVGGDAP